MTTTVKTNKRRDGARTTVLKAIEEARKEFGENNYLLEYDHHAQEWKAQKKVVKGDAGMVAYLERHGCNEDSVLLGAA
ncbi:hypothetical protein COD21_24545 [Bacillus cereus]|uniref:hypothetical protein n=1 Tax=Bacillus cereus TaxID=1396 RepID=UPI000BFD90F3|nr:hypothetical protein [Bacillus cereus]PGU06698.1 hypothetical protein COD21_24545 [Bacillus cereus]